MVASADDVRGAESVQLFVARARAARPDFALTDANAAAVADICRRLDGLPLAIELAASRVAVLPPLALHDRLDRRLSLLTGGPRDAPLRLQTLRAAIAWSFDLLSPEEQALIRRLAVFVGGFTLDAAVAVAQEQNDAFAVSSDAASTRLSGLDHIASFVDKSLVRLETDVRTAADAATRYGMLETIREYAQERLAATGEEPRVRDRHADFYSALAEQAKPGLRGPQQRQWFDRMTAEHDNLRVALARLIAHSDGGPALRIANALQEFWVQGGHFREGRDWYGRILARGDGPTSERALALAQAGELAWMGNDLGEALRLAEASLSTAGSIGDSFVTARACMLKGTSLSDDDPAAAGRLISDALSLFRSRGDGHWVAVAALNAGELGAGRDAPELARTLFEEALAGFRAEGYARGIAMALRALGDMALGAADYLRAWEVWTESLELFRAQRSSWRVVEVLHGFARLAVASGMTEFGCRLFGVVDAQFNRLDSPRIVSDGGPEVVAIARSRLGEVAFRAAWDAGRGLSIEEAIAEVVAMDYSRGKTVADSPTVRPMSVLLTPRERDVLRLLADGLTDKEIAATLGLRYRTVTHHVETILAKLGVPTRAAASARAVRDGLA